MYRTRTFSSNIIGLSRSLDSVLILLLLAVGGVEDSLGVIVLYDLAVEDAGDARPAGEVVGGDPGLLLLLRPRLGPGQVHGHGLRSLHEVVLGVVADGGGAVLLLLLGVLAGAGAGGGCVRGGVGLGLLARVAVGGAVARARGRGRWGRRAGGLRRGCSEG